MRPSSPIGVTRARSTRMSGTIPAACIERPPGVKYSAVVSLTARDSEIGMTVCTEPLPKLSVPMMMARPWSCRAPATISEALAEPPLISTTTGTPLWHVVLAGAVGLRRIGQAPLGIHHFTAAHEQAGHIDAGAKHAARVVAQVEHHAFQRLLFLQFVQRPSPRRPRWFSGTGKCAHRRNHPRASACARWLP